MIFRLIFLVQYFPEFETHVSEGVWGFHHTVVAPPHHNPPQCQRCKNWIMGKRFLKFLSIFKIFIFVTKSVKKHSSGRKSFCQHCTLPNHGKPEHTSPEPPVPLGSMANSLYPGLPYGQLVLQGTPLHPYTHLHPIIELSFNIAFKVFLTVNTIKSKENLLQDKILKLKKLY